MITDLTSFLIISCYTKFRFGERGAQCILGEGGPIIFCLQSHGIQSDSCVLLWMAETVCQSLLQKNAYFLIFFHCSVQRNFAKHA